MASQQAYFLKETTTERILNRCFGFLVRFGIGARHSFLLETRGRKSGKIFSTPVNLLEMDGRRYLVAARGETGWARNARAAGEVTLVKGSRRSAFSARELGVDERPAVLKEFLERYATTVQRFFPMPKGAPVEAFREVAPLQPVFELTEKR